MIFQRDHALFEAEFPELELLTVRPFMPFRYLVSGGVSMRQLMPSFSFPLWRGVESVLCGRLAMFAFVELRRR